MNYKRTYTYVQDGHEVGPYFQSQIIKLTETGMIRADAMIRCVEDGTNGPIAGFLASLEEELKGAVAVSDVKMPFGSMVVFMVKWAFASIPAAIILFVGFAIFTGVVGRL